MKNIENYNQDFASVWAAMDRTEKQMAETSRIVAETSRKVDETSRKVDETTANIDKYLAELKETRKEVGGIGNSFGMFAECYFFQSLKRSKQFGGITYNAVLNDVKNSHTKPNGEVLIDQFDIVMYNGDSIAIIEIKNKVQKEDIRDLVYRKLGDFKLMFPEHAPKKIYLGVAGFSYDKVAEQEAIKYGVGILKLSGENNVVVQDQHLIVY